MTYIAAYIVSMVFEVPLLGLEKFVFPKPTALKDTQNFESHENKIEDMWNYHLTVELSSNIDRELIIEQNMELRF